MNFFKNKKILSTQLILFLFIWFWTFITPLSMDDLQSSHLTSIQILRFSKEEWFNWNGRFFGQTIFRFMASGNRLFWSMTNGLVFVALITLIASLSTKQKFEHIHFTRFIAISMACLVFIPNFGETILWRAGSGNYLWMTVANLFLIWIYVKTDFLMGNFKRSYLIPLLPFMLLALIAGWSNENTAGGTLIILIAHSFLLLKNRVKINFIYILGLVFFILGYLALLLAPGNKIRALKSLGAAYFKKPFFTRFSDNFIAVTKTVFSSNMDKLLLVSIVIAIVLSLNFWLNKTAFINGLTWSFSGMAIIYALSFAPLGQNEARAYFGGIIYLLISLFSLIPSKKLFNKSFDGIIIQLGFTFLLFLVL
ncbi:DUF6056 family protein [Liquorilactobacillus nagelii]|uniref:DUF6056 family protein n=1 Tax=Liquorilactobacillus nagelii TaxID=82688 RepID=UPI001CC970FA|nr:DUF6056 family protein [Liquorilactobacillus nagelii]ULQ48727.1 DUF6056 family protein [Liquorilactobacillus nagelii]